MKWKPRFKVGQRVRVVATPTWASPDLARARGKVLTYERRDLADKGDTPWVLIYFRNWDGHSGCCRGNRRFVARKYTGHCWWVPERDLVAVKDGQ